MYVVRKVRGQERYCVKCGCGLKHCPYIKCETYLSYKTEAEGSRDMLQEMWGIINHNFEFKGRNDVIIN